MSRWDAFAICPGATNAAISPGQHPVEAGTRRPEGFPRPPAQGPPDRALRACRTGAFPGWPCFAGPAGRGARCLDGPRLAARADVGTWPSKRIRPLPPHPIGRGDGCLLQLAASAMPHLRRRLDALPSEFRMRENAPAGSCAATRRAQRGALALSRVAPRHGLASAHATRGGRTSLRCTAYEDARRRAVRSCDAPPDARRPASEVPPSAP